MPTKQELAKVSLRGSVTETGTDTFTEKVVDTNLGIRGQDIFVATGVWFETNAAMAGDTDAFTIQVCYSSQSGIIQIDDPDWLFGTRWGQHLTTSGGGVIREIDYWPINHFPIAVQNLYLGVQGNSLGAAARGSFKMEGYHIKVSTTEFFKLAQTR